MGLIEDVYDDSTVKCVYMAAVLILVVVIMMHVLKIGWYYERFTNDKDLVEDQWSAGKIHQVETPLGAGYANAPLPPMSGPGIRFNVFTDTSQVPYQTGYNERF